MEYKQIEEYKNQLLEGLRHAGIQYAHENQPIDVLEDMYVDEVGEESFKQLQMYYGQNESNHMNVIEQPLTFRASTSNER